MNRKLIALGTQLAGIWRQLGLNQRISVVAAAVIVVALLGSLAFWSGRADEALLYGRLEEAEAAKVVAALDEAKIPYRVGQGGNSIYIASDKIHQMRMQLATKGIPRSDGVGFEIFDKPNFGISDFIQRANYMRALQGELARTISQLDEVESARVMIVIPENRLLIDNNKKPTAAVFVRVHKELMPQSVNSIRFLVANSVEGLQPAQVTVVDNRGQVLSENMDNESAVGLTSSQLGARRNLEQYLAKKTEGMLDAVLGGGQSVVRVAAEINFDTTTVTEERFDPESQVVRISTINDENTDTTTGAEGGGVPGVVVNSGSETNVTGGSMNNSKLRKKVVNNQYEISRSVSNVTQLAGGLKRLSAAVFVAARFEGTGPARKIQPRTPEELEKLRRIVQMALGIENKGGAQDSITLEEMPFNDQVTEATLEMTRQDKKQFWWNQIQTIAYPVLAVGIFLAFWRALKKTPMETIPLGVPVGELAGGQGRPGADGAGRTAAGGAGPAGGARPAGTGGFVSVEAFNQLVRENPNNLTHAIQSWLDHGKSTRN